MRIAILLGKELAEWIFSKWTDKWHRHPQPPSYYWTFKEMIASLAKKGDPITIASRVASGAQFSVRGEESVSVKNLLDRPEEAAAYLSRTCMRIFHGESELRSAARSLDYFAYGHEIEKRSSGLANAIIKHIGDKEINEQKERIAAD